jgi:hypothetical protein
MSNCSKDTLMAKCLVCVVGFLVVLAGCSSDDSKSPVKETVPSEKAGKEQSAPEPAQSKAFPAELSMLLASDDGLQLLIGIKYPPRLELWDLAKGKQVWSTELVNAVMYGDFSRDGKWIAVGESLGSSECEAVLIDRVSGNEERRYPGSHDYAAVSFRANTRLSAESVRFDEEGNEEVIELTWPLADGQPTIRPSRSERWPGSSGTFPVTDNRITLTRGEDKKSVSIRYAGRTKMLGQSTEAYRFGAIAGSIAIVAQLGSLTAVQLPEMEVIGKFLCTYTEDGAISWKFINGDDQESELTKGLESIAKLRTTW